LWPDRSENGAGVQVVPSEDVSSTPRSDSSVSYQRSKESLVAPATGAVSVAVVLSFVWENHAVRPAAGRTGMARARSWATAWRAGLMLPQLRLGCTRLVSRMLNDRDSGSITMSVPV
jgi:hypothetical protein